MAKRRENDSFNIAFLDVMSCGFGAIILLLMITRVSAPIPLEISELSNEGSVLDMQRQLFEIRGETNIYNRELNAKQEQISQYEERIARFRRELSSLENQLSNSSDQSSVNGILQGQLALAQQNLTEEMPRLQANQAELRLTDSVGGVLVEREYVVFIIAISGSMFNYGWSRMLEVFVDTLDIYPEVRGIQVMNDMGEYLFCQFSWRLDSRYPCPPVRLYCSACAAGILLVIAARWKVLLLLSGLFMILVKKSVFMCLVMILTREAEPAVLGLQP